MNFQLARTNMVEQQVRPWQVLNNEVLDALAQIPREIFVPPAYIELAYADTDIPLENGQSMLSPKVVGRALEALAITPQEKVLEIGSGTGYITACLAKLAQNVTSIELYTSLLASAQKNLMQVQCRNVTLEQGDGVLGWALNGPYHVILIGASYPLGVPQRVCEQLAIGGRLFAFCGQAPSMQAVLIERQASTQFHTKILFESSTTVLINAALPPTFCF